MPERNEDGQLVGDRLTPAWVRRPRPLPTHLAGQYVSVSPLTGQHAQPLYEALCAAQDRQLWTYRSTDPPADVAGMADLIEHTTNDADLITFVLAPRGEQPRGIASYTRIDESTGQIEIAGVLFARSLQRTRAATEAIHLLMKNAFDELGYRRCEWKCDSLNEPSRRAAVRLGFVYEGRFRHHMVVKGRNRDTDWFSVTDTEWPDVRNEHERWLEPSNFDDDGQQRTRLDVPRAGRRH